jgi:hypothetical protein
MDFSVLWLAEFSWFLVFLWPLARFCRVVVMSLYGKLVNFHMIRFFVLVSSWPWPVFDMAFIGALFSLVVFHLLARFLLVNFYAPMARCFSWIALMLWFAFQRLTRLILP